MAFTKSRFNFLRGIAPGIRVIASKRKMPHLAQKRSDERHLVDFFLGDKAIRHAQALHEREHVKITGVIRSVNFCTWRLQVFLAHDVYARAGQKEKNFQCR